MWVVMCGVVYGSGWWCVVGMVMGVVVGGTNREGPD